MDCHEASCLIHSVDKLKRRLIDVCSAVLNSRFLTRLLTSGEEDFQRVSVLKDISSTACELTMLILSISVTLNVTCLTVTSLIMKSYQQRLPIVFCSFYKVVHWQILRYGVRF